jgi:long-chain acyl-CoA synthetase
LFSAADIAVIEGYGLTESSPGISLNRFEPENRKMGTVGIPLPGVEIKFLEDGEILAKGDNIMKGYFKRPDLTAEVIDSEGWLHTGDICEMVDGKFLNDVSAVDVIGSKIRCELTPYIEIANFVEIL